MKTRILLLLLFIICWNTFVNAQAPLQLNVVAVSDSAPKLGDVITIFANLKNINTTQTFSGIINFGVANSSQILTTTNILSSPPYTGTQVTIAPTEEIPALFTVVVDAQYFKAGPDIIVIWPIALVPAQDSVIIPINIQAATGIEELNADKWNWKINNNHLVLQSINQNKALKQVRVFALNGTLLVSQTTANNPTELSIEQLPQSMYICELLFENGERKMLKFVK